MSTNADYVAGAPASAGIGRTLGDGPDFIGIGAQRAGTTWLHHHLSRHPDVWIPPVKEVHYFDRSPRYPTPNWLAESDPWRRLLLQFPFDLKLRRKLARSFTRALRSRAFRSFAWHCRYAFGRYDDAWYRSLFRDGRGRLRGEITPAYGVLDDADVAHVAALFPSIRIIFVMRHPVERFWSSVRLMGADRLPLERLLELPSQPNYALRGDYLHALSTWTRHISPGRVFTGFFDDIEEAPAAFYARVSAFLGLKPLSLAPKDARRRVNAAASADMPPALRRAVAARYHDPVRQLSAMFGGHATRWLTDIERDLARPPDPP
jgi:hypothetical protein